MLVLPGLLHRRPDRSVSELVTPAIFYRSPQVPVNLIMGMCVELFKQTIGKIKPLVRESH